MATRGCRRASTRCGSAHAGVPKFPHGVVIHAVQWLPALAWAMRRARVPEGTRLRQVALAVAGSTLFLFYAIANTALGRARFDTVPATAALLAAAVVGLGVPAIVTAWGGLLNRRSPPPAAGRTA